MTPLLAWAAAFAVREQPSPQRAHALGYIVERLPADIHLTNVSGRTRHLAQQDQLVDHLLDIAANERAAGRQHLIVGPSRHRTLEEGPQIGGIVGIESLARLNLGGGHMKMRENGDAAVFRGKA